LYLSLIIITITIQRNLQLMLTNPIQQQPFNGLCSGTTRVGRYQKKHCLLPWHRALLHTGWVSPPPVFWIFIEQGKIMETEVPTVRVGATPTGLTAPLPHNPPKVFYRPDALLPPNQHRQSTEGNPIQLKLICNIISVTIDTV